MEEDHDWTWGNNSQRGYWIAFIYRVVGGKTEYVKTPTGRMRTWKSDIAVKKVLERMLAKV